MSLWAKIFTLFPILHFALVCLSLYLAIDRPLYFLLFLFFLYLLPPLLYRLHRLAFGPEEGRYYLDKNDYVPWWGAHQLQILYNAFPCLEAILRLVPGLYSAWLRLWGSSIGRGVYWSASTELLDRGCLQIGNDVIFGHRVLLSAHLVKKTDKGLLLYIRRIVIGDGAFLGAGCCLGPGTSVAEGQVLAADTRLSVPHSTDPKLS